MHGFKFICLLQPRSFIVVNGKVVALGSITHFVTTQLSLRDESGRVYTKTLDLFPIKLGQYSIIFILPWFKKHLPHIQFNKNTITFNSPHCLQHCLPSHQAMTVSGLNTPFDHSPRLSTLSDQVMNVSSTDDFALNPCSCLLLYHRYCSRCSSYQAVNISNIDKPTNPRFCFSSFSICNQTSVSADNP